MPRRIHLLNAHPHGPSFCRALADAYQKGAEAAGAEVRRTDLASLAFDPVLHGGYHVRQPLEPDLERTLEDLRWAGHLAWATPVWWGSVPALFKGWMDRVLLPGIAFRYHANDPFWDRLLYGRTGRLIVTMDTPRWFFWLVYGDPALRQVKRTTLEFSGVGPVRTLIAAEVRKASDAKRARWLAAAEAAGRQDASAPDRPKFRKP